MLQSHIVLVVGTEQQLYVVVGVLLILLVLFIWITGSLCPLVSYLAFISREVCSISRPQGLVKFLTY